MNTLDFAVRGLSEQAASDAAVAIRPDLAPFHFLDCDQFDAVWQAGYDAALAHWPQASS